MWQSCPTRLFVIVPLTLNANVNTRYIEKKKKKKKQAAVGWIWNIKNTQWCDVWNCVRVHTYDVHLIHARAMLLRYYEYAFVIYFAWYIAKKPCMPSISLRQWCPNETLLFWWVTHVLNHKKCFLSCYSLNDICNGRRARENWILLCLIKHKHDRCLQHWLMTGLTGNLHQYYNVYVNVSIIFFMRHARYWCHPEHLIL